MESLIVEIKSKCEIEILAYCLMPNHWHMVVRTKENGDLARFFRRLTQVHAQRLHKMRDTRGRGYIYQSRYKSFPILTDEYLVTVIRYVEANALRAALVERAENWRWCSLYRRIINNEKFSEILTPPPIQLPKPWSDFVNLPITPEQVGRIRLDYFAQRK